MSPIIPEKILYLVENQAIMILSKRLFLLLVVLTWIGIPACNEDKDDMEVNTEELLIGTWVTTDVEVTTLIGGQSVADYLVDTVGLSTAEAAVQEALFHAFLVNELEVTLTLHEDHTYESEFSGGMDSGTWSLSADEKTLTLVEGGEVIIVTINSISSSVMNATIADEIEFDIDNDSNTPDVTINASADLILEK